MNKYEILAGELLFNEEKRLAYAPHISIDFIEDKDLFILLKELCEPDFTYKQLYEKHGKKVLIRAMDLQNEYANLKRLTTGKICES